jgi:HSP20 family protein
MTNSNVTQNAQPSAGEEAALIPAVDIFEDGQGITLKADLPGVSRERLSIQVDKDTLSIEGDVQIDIPDGTEPLYADLRATRFRRSFTLSQELETDRISAQLNNGELTVHVPKRAEVQPRKIEVKVG